MKPKCKVCKGELPEFRRVFCSDICANTWNNKDKKGIFKVDKLGRKHLSCVRCGRILKRIEYRGTGRFVCNNCIKRMNHMPRLNSIYVKTTLRKGDNIEEVLLELTQDSLRYHWHFLNGRAIQGRQRAINNYRSKVWQLLKKGYVKTSEYDEMKNHVHNGCLCPDCFNNGVTTILKPTNLTGRWHCPKCNYLAEYIKVKV